VRVGFFLTAPNGGGAERAMIAVANYFAAEGFEVDVVFGRPDGPCRRDIDPRIRIVDLGVTRLRHMLVPMGRYLRTERPDVVISALMPCDVVMLISRRLSRWNGRLIVAIQSHPLEVRRHALRLLDRLWPFFIRHLYSGADSVVGISSGVADVTAMLLGQPRERVPVLHNPVVGPGFAAGMREVPDHPWFRDGDVPVILAAGRLTRAKDYATLLRAFAQVARRRKARLIIIGEGEERPALERLARDLDVADRLAMPGFVANPYAWMRQARLFVLSSRWEGFGNVIAEALACGTPVVATDCPSGPTDILNGGEYGRLVPVGDAGALADAVDAALDASVDHEVLVARGMEFSVERIAPRYLELVEGVVAR
jgi:glycosyltransferase involved in cell wall biosynthesis